MENQIDQVDSTELISNLNFCIIDLETTGGNLQNDQIIEIGLIKVHNLKIVDRLGLLINPKMKIPEFIQKLTTISDDDVADAATIEEVIDQLVEFMGRDSILVAHNITFDIPFFNSVLTRLNRTPLTNKTLCTNLMAKYLIPDVLNSNLNYMCRIFGIKHGKAHRALDDAQATANLLITFLNIFIKKGIKKVNHLYYPRNKYELDLVNFKEEDSSKVIEKLDGIFAPYLVLAKGEKGIIEFAFVGRENNSKDLNFVKKKIQNNNWPKCTIQIFGSFLEGLYNLNKYFSKMPPTTKNEILQYMWTEHLAMNRPSSNVGIENNSPGLHIKHDKDFIVLKHLIPDQYIVVPVVSLSSKYQLTFRFPGNEKKFLQFVESRFNRLMTNKIKKSMFSAGLKQFIEQYLKNHTKNEVPLNYFCFSKSEFKRNKKGILKLMENFLAENPESYPYPKKYI